MSATRRCAVLSRLRDIGVTVLVLLGPSACAEDAASTPDAGGFEGADAGPGGSGGTGGSAGTGGSDLAAGFPGVVPTDDPLAPDPEDEGPAMSPEEAGPVGPDPAACDELEDAAPADLCAPSDGAGGAESPPDEPAAPPADCAAADDVCDEPDFCAVGTDPDCADRKSVV